MKDMQMTTRSGIDLPSLDSVLGTALSNASRAGQSPRSVALAVLCRGRSQNVAPGSVRVWLRSRGNAEVRSLVADRFLWSKLSVLATNRVAESPSKVRVRVARRAVAALLRGFTAGENALIAILLVSILDDPNGWDSVQLTKRLGVQLGVSHATIQARAKKLSDAGVLTLLSKGRGVPTRVRFAPLPRGVKDAYREHEIAVALVDALAGEPASDVVEDAARILRTVDAPALGYGDLTHDAWNLMLLSALDARSTATPARIARGRKVLRGAGLDEDVTVFADAVADLSEGEPTTLRDAAEAKRRAEADERASSAERARQVKEALYAKTLPALYARAGEPPAAPKTDAQRIAARKWMSGMREACAPALAKPELAAALRVELRRALLRRGWTGEHVKRGVEMILPKGTDTLGGAA